MQREPSKKHQGILIDEHPYSTSKCSELIVRDFLATDRTVLANERTFLAYVRTAVALSLGGVSLIKFINILIIQIFGWLLIPLGIFIFVIGAIRYRKMARVLAKVTLDREEQEVETTLVSEDEQNTGLSEEKSNNPD